jgi:uncharacterized protein
MSVEENVQIVRDFFAAMGGHNKQDPLALAAEDIEWIIPGGDWPLAGTHPGRAGIGGCAQEGVRRGENDIPAPPEFIAQGDRVLIVGVATGKIKATNKSFKDDWVFDITIRDRKVKIREYIDTQALRGPRRWTRPGGRRALAICGPSGRADGGSPSRAARSSNAQP